MSIQKIREDILSLRGANVKIFGQPTTLNDSVGDDLVDIIDILDQVSDKEVELITSVYNDETDDFDTMEFDTVEQFVDYMEDELGEWKEVSHGNSYNWTSPVSNDFDFRVLKDYGTGDFYIQLMVHRFGDVRGNYTDYALLRYDYEEGFLYDIMECNKQVDLDDKHYASIDVLANGYEVYTHDGEYVDTIYDLEDWNADKVAEG
jgi:hypothetical protein